MVQFSVAWNRFLGFFSLLLLCSAVAEAAATKVWLAAVVAVGLLLLLVVESVDCMQEMQLIK